MTNEQLQKKQDELDYEELPCPKCGKKEMWGFLREWGVCNECVANHFEEEELKRIKNPV